MASAGDVERYVYCAHNWHLSRQGRGGDAGRGVEAHRNAADAVVAASKHAQRARTGLRASTAVLAVAGAATLATLVFVARAEASATFVVLTTALVLLNGSAALLTLGLYEQETATRLRWEARGVDPGRLRTLVVPVPPDRGQWTLRAIALGASVAFLAIAGSSLGVHPLRPVLVSLAAVLVVTSAAGLGQAAVTTYRARRALGTPGVVPGTVVDLDLDGGGTLLEDPAWGLAGRPDYLLRTPSGLVPVEFKSGRTPERPHGSHRMQLACYLRLVETCLGRAAYGLLVYPEGVFRVAWDDGLKKDLHATLLKIQAAQAAGRADRDHTHPGKCLGCARRGDCDQALPAPAALRGQDTTVLAPAVPS